MKTLREIVGREVKMVKWVLDGEAADDIRSWVFPAKLDGERGIKRVTNLGWLLKHRKEILHPMQGQAFSVHGWRYGERIGIPPDGPLTIEEFHPILFANLVDGRTFAAQWFDASVLKHWLERPSFEGYAINWSLRPSGSTDCYVGDDIYQDLNTHTRVPIL